MEKVAALDTNVLVRFFVNDEPAMHRAAQELMKNRRVWISTTVVLETEWVLRSAYALEKKQVLALLVALLSLPNVSVQDHDSVALALELAESGLTFPDALHLAVAREAQVFVSFDKRLVKKSAQLSRAIKVVDPQALIG